MHEECKGGGGCSQGCMACHMAMPMNREIKLAMLDKKEKILRAKLEFIDDIRDIVEKMSDEDEEEEEE